MARCTHKECGRWQPDLLIRRAHLGMRLDGRWFCSTSCVEASALKQLGEARLQGGVSQPRVPPLKLGVLLQHQRAVEPDEIRRALSEQRHTGLRIGQQLRRDGLLSGQAVLRALAAQASCAYIWFSEVPTRLPAPCGLSRDAISALGLVPFSVDPKEQRMKVAATAPLPRTAIAALRELTGWAVEAYLVSDDQWPALLAAYRGAADEPSAGMTVESFGAAAAHIARVTSRAHDVRLTHARCDPFMWVRLEGPHVAEDLLVPVGDPAREQSCRAVPTSH